LTSIAVPVPKIIAAPIPCSTRESMSMAADGEAKASSEDVVKKNRPAKKIFFIPKISASFPRGTMKTAEESR